MRDITRIQRIFDKINIIRQKDPDLRFGQLLYNIGYLSFPYGMYGNGVVNDPYNYEDTVFESKLDEWIDKHILPKE